MMIINNSNVHCVEQKSVFALPAILQACFAYDYDDGDKDDDDDDDNDDDDNDDDDNDDDDIDNGTHGDTQLVIFMKVLMLLLCFWVVATVPVTVCNGKDEEEKKGQHGSSLHHNFV